MSLQLFQAPRLIVASEIVACSCSDAVVELLECSSSVVYMCWEVVLGCEASDETSGLAVVIV